MTLDYTHFCFSSNCVSAIFSRLEELPLSQTCKYLLRDILVLTSLGQGFQSRGSFCLCGCFPYSSGWVCGVVLSCAVPVGLRYCSFLSHARFHEQGGGTAHLGRVGFLTSALSVGTFLTGEEFCVLGQKDFLYPWPTHLEPVLLPININKNVPTSFQTPPFCAMSSYVSCFRCCLPPVSPNTLSPTRKIISIFADSFLFKSLPHFCAIHSEFSLL